MVEHCAIQNLDSIIHYKTLKSQLEAARRSIFAIQSNRQLAEPEKEKNIKLELLSLGRICIQEINRYIKLYASITFSQGEMMSLNVNPTGISDEDFQSEKKLNDEADETSNVELVIFKESSTRYIRKKVGLSSNSLERDIQSRLRDALFVRLHCAYKEKSDTFLILEHVEGGDLYRIIERYHKTWAGSISKNVRQGDLGCLMPEDLITHFMSEIVVGLKELHSKNICHRDMKPENIFVGKDGHIKIGDFGSSTIIVPGSKANGKLGTFSYMAPEVMAGNDYGKEVDIYSIGMVLYAMVMLATPYDSRFSSMKNYIKPKLSFYFEPSRLAKDLICALCEHTPDSRLVYGKEPRGFGSIERHLYLKDVDWTKVNARTNQCPLTEAS